MSPIPTPAAAAARASRIAPIGDLASPSNAFGRNAKVVAWNPGTRSPGPITARSGRAGSTGTGTAPVPYEVREKAQAPRVGPRSIAAQWPSPVGLPLVCSPLTAKLPTRPGPPGGVTTTSTATMLIGPVLGPAGASPSSDTTNTLLEAFGAPDAGIRESAPLASCTISATSTPIELSGTGAVPDAGTNDVSSVTRTRATSGGSARTVSAGRAAARSPMSADSGRSARSERAAPAPKAGADDSAISRPVERSGPRSNVSRRTGEAAVTPGIARYAWATWSNGRRSAVAVPLMSAPTSWATWSRWEVVHVRSNSTLYTAIAVAATSRSTGRAYASAFRAIPRPASAPEIAFPRAIARSMRRPMSGVRRIDSTAPASSPIAGAARSTGSNPRALERADRSCHRARIASATRAMSRPLRVRIAAPRRPMPDRRNRITEPTLRTTGAAIPRIAATAVPAATVSIGVVISGA